MKLITWSADCVISSAAGTTKFAKLYVLIVISLTPKNENLLEQLISGFKKTINRNKYQLKVSIERQNHNLDYLIETSFKGVNILFVLSFEDNAY